MTARALALASSITAQKQLDNVVWRAIYTALRKKLRGDASDAGTRWAPLILEALRTHKLVTERNLSPQLQLSSLLLNVTR